MRPRLNILFRMTEEIDPVDDVTILVEQVDAANIGHQRGGYSPGDLNHSLM